METGRLAFSSDGMLHPFQEANSGESSMISILKIKDNRLNTLGRKNSFPGGFLEEIVQIDCLKEGIKHERFPGRRCKISGILYSWRIRCPNPAGTGSRNPLCVC
jgi:hypothetical protein